MVDLTTNYGSLELRNPLVAGSSGLTDNVENMLEIEKYGAGAVVLKSLFEEEIIREMKAEMSRMGSPGFIYPETLEFYDYFDGPKESTARYIELIHKSKSKLSIPVIASINCVDSENWTYFPKKIAEAGADALELNIFILPADINKTASDNEKLYFNIIENVKNLVNIPVFVKLSYYASNLASFLTEISKTGIDGLVLFNRFYNPDIDIETLQITSGAILSSPADIYQTLRWVAIMSNRVECDIIASTGIHNAEGVIKQILAGASAVQLASTLYKNGVSYIETILKEFEAWMIKKKYTSMNDFKGTLSQEKSSNPAVYSRVQFMKYFRGFPVS
ncbi:MAG: dihydroorotate dehydrogenase-like protein [Bacteroidales bacterium]|nr:dihydroorotate dehydrogenase-like protein [Bacteroidales bacterium]